MSHVHHAYTGTVLSGRGNARKHMEAEYAAFQEATGESLIQGSLNLILSEPVFLNLETALEVSQGERLLWRAELSGLPVWVYRFPHAPLHVVEVLASVRLRDVLDLEDGATVPLCLQQADVVKLSVRQRVAWFLLWKGRGSWSYHKDWYYLRTRSLSIDIGATQRPSQQSMILSLLRFVRRRFR